MRKKSLKSFMLLLLLAVGVSSAFADVLEFDFEDDGAHRSSGSNSYVTNSYEENGVTISLSYADAVTTGGPLSGNANVMGRIAKNTTNSPVVLIGPIDNTGNKITKITYVTKGLTAMKMVFEYSNDNSTWKKLQTLSAMPTSKTVETVDNLYITDNSVYLKFTVSVTSSTSSNRDFQLDDIILTYEKSDTPSKVNVATINGISPTEVEIDKDGDFIFDITYADGISASDATIAWESSNEDVLSNVDGSYLAGSSKGSVDVTVTVTPNDTETYNEVSKTFTVKVIDPNANDGSLEKPYTVTEARAAIDANDGITGVYAKGIVSEIVTAYSSQYGNISYNISEDGTTTADQLQAFRGMSYNGESFTSEDDIQVGDVVVIYGNLTKYNSTYEFAAGNQLVSLSRKELLDNEILGLEDAYTIDMTKGQEELTLKASATSGTEVQYEIVETVTTVPADGYEFEDGYLVVSKKGTIVIRAFVEANDDYKAAEKTVTVTVLGAKEDAVIDVDNMTLAWGESFTMVENENYLTDGTVTLTSSNPAVASVNGLTVKAEAVGEATITVTAAEGEEYKALEEAVTFTVKVTAPVAKTEAPGMEPTTLFYEGFEGSTGYTEKDNDVFNNGAGNGTLSKENENWDISAGYGAGDAAKFGSSKNAGSATTPSIAVESGKTYTLTFVAAPWASEESTMNVTVDGGTINGISADAMTTSEWNNYEATITATSNVMTITFKASKNRFFLDEVTVTKPADVTTPKLTLSATGYASYCCEYPLDFSEKSDDFGAWYVTDVDMDAKTVTFEEITGTIKGGEAFFLYGTPNKEVELTFAESSENTLSDNQLEGTLAPTYVENEDGLQYYGLSGGNFVKMKNGVVKANKAFLPVLTDEGEARLTIIFGHEEATGIKSMTTEQMGENVLDLQGRRVQNPVKGVYVVNGKKVIFK